MRTYDLVSPGVVSLLVGGSTLDARQHAAWLCRVTINRACPLWSEGFYTYGMSSGSGELVRLLWGEVTAAAPQRLSASTRVGRTQDAGWTGCTVIRTTHLQLRKGTLGFFGHNQESMFLKKCTGYAGSWQQHYSAGRYGGRMIVTPKATASEPGTCLPPLPYLSAP